MKPRSSSRDNNRSGGGKGRFDRAPAKGGRGGPRQNDRGGRNDAPRSFYGVLEISSKGNFVKPTARSAKFVAELDKKDLNNAQDGDIVFVARQEEPAKPGKKPRLGGFKIMKALGSAQDVRNYSLLSALEAGLQPQFPPKVVDECYGFTVPELGKREDLRDLPLVTIDGEDARDFDDAVYARPADDGNGWYAIIAIADVAHYVTPGSLLDKEALRRGNSTYFPDRVIPMLPERLSNDLCSLRPNEDRACMHCHVWIDNHGQIVDWNIGRGLMRSKARLTYTQVQKTLDGQPDETTTPLLEQIQYLYKTYQLLREARTERGALEITSTERKIVLDQEGGVAAVLPKEHLEAHELIEEFMITANVVIAHALENKNAPCMYRVHDTPSAFKVATLGQFLKPLGMEMPKDSGELTPALFNSVLRKVKETPELEPVINDLVLRSQAQAVYDPINIGHFGLALEKYAHFTSPIRRYADLLNHRSLIRAYDLGEDGLGERDASLMEEWAQTISDTERASMLAERVCVDRFTAHFMQKQVGKELTGRITSVTNFGLFVSLLDGVAEALIPMRMLPQDYYDYIEEKQMLVGGRSGLVYRLGGRVSIQILGVDAITGSITAQLLGGESANLPGFEDADRERPRMDPRDRKDRKPQGDRDFKPRREFRERDDRGGDRDRGPRREYNDRPPRRDNDERPRRPYGDRPARSEGGEDRPRRPYGDRPQRSEGGDRPKRPYGDRPARSEGGEDRPRRPYGDRPQRSEGGDRPKRPYGDRPQSRDGGGFGPRGDRPAPYGGGRDAKSFDKPRSYKSRDEGRDSYEDRPRRSYGDRPERSEGGDDRPRRAYGDRPQRSDGPSRPYNPRPRPEEGSDERPPRRDDGPRSGKPYRGGDKKKAFGGESGGRDRFEPSSRKSFDGPSGPKSRSGAPKPGGFKAGGKPGGFKSGGKPAGKGGKKGR